MSALFPDTSADAELVLLDLLRKAPPWRKLEMVGELNRTVQLLAGLELRRRHPEEGQGQLARRLADLVLGPDLAKQAYGSLDGG